MSLRCAQAPTTHSATETPRTASTIDRGDECATVSTTHGERHDGAPDRGRRPAVLRRDAAEQQQVGHRLGRAGEGEQRRVVAETGVRRAEQRPAAATAPARATPAVTSRPSPTTTPMPRASARVPPPTSRGKTTTATACGSQKAILSTMAPAAYVPGLRGRQGGARQQQVGVGEDEHREQRVRDVGHLGRGVARHRRAERPGQPGAAGAPRASPPAPRPPAATIVAVTERVATRTDDRETDAGDRQHGVLPGEAREVLAPWVEAERGAREGERQEGDGHERRRDDLEVERGDGHGDEQQRDHGHGGAGQQRQPQRARRATSPASPAATRRAATVCMPSGDDRADHEQPEQRAQLGEGLGPEQCGRPARRARSPAPGPPPCPPRRAPRARAGRGDRGLGRGAVVREGHGSPRARGVASGPAADPSR